MAARTLALIDYGSGNLRSAAKALERAAGEAEIPARIAVTGEPGLIASADAIVLPGVGAFGACMAGLERISGMRAALEDAVARRGVPFLGICVGMQLLAERGHEHGVHRGLGWIAGEVRRLAPGDASCRVPHMGWNTLSRLRPHPLLEGIADGEHFYFVHSFAFAARERDDVVAATDYGGAVTSMIARGNIAGTQFHPEKSQRAGLRLLANFLRWRP